jgi:pyruvate/2-oxoglutarate dehydrogenase complex dihydrolipoamide dehydrogenase (E3) component
VLAHIGKIITKLTGVLAAMAKMRTVLVVRGYGSFATANHVADHAKKRKEPTASPGETS